MACNIKHSKSKWGQSCYSLITTITIDGVVMVDWLVSDSVHSIFSIIIIIIIIIIIRTAGLSQFVIEALPQNVFLFN